MLLCTLLPGVTIYIFQLALNCVDEPLFYHVNNPISLINKTIYSAGQVIDPGMASYAVVLSEGWKGQVVVTYNNQSGTMCDDYHSDKNCMVICQELGFTYT